jgi:hypothetical protein
LYVGVNPARNGLQQTKTRWHDLVPPHVLRLVNATSQLFGKVVISGIPALRLADRPWLL